MNVLALDTSSVRETVIGITRFPDTELSLSLREKISQEQKLIKAIDHALSLTQTALDEIELIAVGVGPGSFTGLRIGLSVARGLAWTNRIPIVGVSSLELNAVTFPVRDETVVPVSDAKMKKVYGAAFRNGERLLPDTDVDPAELLSRLKKIPSSRYHFVGDGVPLIEDALRASALNAVVDSSFSADGRTLCRLGERYYEDEAYAWKGLDGVFPQYLRKSEAENQLEAKK